MAGYVGFAEPSGRSSAPANQPTNPLCCAAAEDKGKGAASEAQESGLDDDTLKCAICFDLCVRPITVSLAEWEVYGVEVSAVWGACWVTMP